MDAVGALTALAGPLLLIALILANAFFVLGEFSLITVERGLVERLAAADARARSVLEAMRQLTVQLSGAQLGITLTSLLVGFLAEPALAGLLEPALGRVPLLADAVATAVAVTAALLISTVLQLVLGEQVPKALAIAHPLRSALLVATPLRAFCWACRPAIHVLNAAANAVVRRLGVEPREEIAAARSIDELEVVIRAAAGEGMLDRPTSRLLVRSVRFGRKTAADAMVPRVAMVALPRAATADDLVAASVASRHERLPVTGRGRDDVVGVADVRDALRVPPERRGSVRVEELMRPPVVVPVTVPLHRVLDRMREARQRTAVVVDEYGGTAGIMTAEDLLEEMAGEIEAQDQPRPPGVGRGRLLPGTAPLDQVLEEVGLELPTGEYATLAGLLLHRLGDLPAVGDRVQLDDGWALSVASLDGHRIAWVAVEPPREATP